MLSELTSADLGEPCLLIVHDNGSMRAGDEAEEVSFFSDLPYITALASDEPYADIAKFFDIVKFHVLIVFLRELGKFLAVVAGQGIVVQNVRRDFRACVFKNRS